MEYTIEQYKRCLQAAVEVMNSIDELQLATMNLQNGYGWKDFGKCLDKVFDMRKDYGKTNSDCCIEAYEKEQEATK